MDAAKTGSFIAELRKERGLTQQQLAERLNVSDKAVSRWETGRGLPDIDNIEALAAVLDVSVAELLHGERIGDPVPASETNAVAMDSLDLARELARRRSVSNIILGIVACAAVIILAIAHLTAPIAIPFRTGVASVERAYDQQAGSDMLVAIFDDTVAGYESSTFTDPDTGDTSVFLTCYQTRMFQLTGRDEFGRNVGSNNMAALGHVDEVDHVYYYPGTPDDVLLYTNEKDPGWAGVMTLPRLAYNGWLIIGLVASAVGLGAYTLLRKHWYARRVLKAALVPICFTVSLIAVLFGHFDEVYNAQFYLSGILLLALVLYILVQLVLSRRTAE